MPNRTVEVHMPTATLLVGCLIILVGVVGEVRGGITSKAVIYFGLCLNQFIQIDMLARMRRMLLAMSAEREAGRPPS